jgi:hypothetical protein
MDSKNTRGGQIGNQNAAKPKLITDALRKHLIQNPHKVEGLISVLVDKALDGDMPAVKELFDRLEGKAVQAVEQKTEHSGEVTVYKWLDE